MLDIGLTTIDKDTFYGSKLYFTRVQYYVQIVLYKVRVNITSYYLPCTSCLGGFYGLCWVYENATSQPQSYISLLRIIVICTGYIYLALGYLSFINFMVLSLFHNQNLGEVLESYKTG
jgi:hypothetical protein